MPGSKVDERADGSPRSAEIGSKTRRIRSCSTRHGVDFTHRCQRPTKNTTSGSKSKVRGFAPKIRKSCPEVLVAAEMIHTIHRRPTARNAQNVRIESANSFISNLARRRFYTPVPGSKVDERADGSPRSAEIGSKTRRIRSCSTRHGVDFTHWCLLARENRMSGAKSKVRKNLANDQQNTA